MIILKFENIKNLNTSLQVGDAVYAHSTDKQAGANDSQTNSDTGTNQFVGILRKATTLTDEQIMELGTEEISKINLKIVELCNAGKKFTKSS